MQPDVEGDDRPTWTWLADGVFLRRHAGFDLNVGLVLGNDRGLVVDTRESSSAGAELLAAVREVTELPLTVVNTHAHLDHFFGNSAFRAADPATPIWAHRRALAEMVTSGEDQRAVYAEAARRQAQPLMAAAYDATVLALPDHVTDVSTDLDLGGRTVRLWHPGLGHTDHDLVVDVSDADVLFAGDLIEQGAPPAFEDSLPLDWPATVSALLDLGRSTIVPGHGSVVDAEFGAAQRDRLMRLAEVISARLAGRPIPEEAEYVGWPAGTVEAALTRV